MSPRPISRPEILLAIALLASPACGPAPAPERPQPIGPAPTAPSRDPNAPVITLLAAPRAPEPAPRDPFAKPGVVAPSNESLSKWVEPPIAGDSSHLWTHFVTSGLRAAVVRRGASLFAVHLDRGVTGPLALPEGTFWIGFDGADRLYAARPDGTLLRARDLAKATEAAGFEPIVSIPSAVAWDVTEGMIAAAAGGFVIVSTDDGASFRYTALPEKQVAAQIAARPDGVVVVVAHEDGDARRPSAWISNDRAARFRASSFQPRSIHRDGARIGGQHGSCEASLASDGATWTTEEGTGTYRLRGAWERALDLGSAPHGQAPERLLSLRDPAAPGAGSPATRIGPDGKCPTKSTDGPGTRGGGGVGFGTLGVGGLGMGGSGAPDGVLPLAGTLPFPPRRSRTSWGFLGDAACAPADTDATWGDLRACKPGRPLTRPSRVARTDAKALTLEVLDLPPGCSAEALLAAGGTAVLSCAKAKGDHAVYLAGRDGRWYAEGSIACDRDLRLFDAKGDGTIGLTCPRDMGEYDLWIRRPASLGTQDAFRKVTVKDAIAYRLLDGGRAVAVTTHGKPAPLPTGIGLGGIGLGGLGPEGIGRGTLRGPKPKQGTSPPKAPAPPSPKKAPAPPAKKPPPPKDDPSARAAAAGGRSPDAARERHTFSIVEDAPDAGQNVLARDLRITDDLTALATTDTEVHFRVEKHPGARRDDADPARTARYVVLDKKRLRDVPAASAPQEIVLKTDVSPLGGLSLSLAMPAPGGLAADATHLYWADTTRGQILRIPKAGGAAEVLADGLASPFAVALDDTRVLFTTLGRAYGEAGSVAFVPKAGGPYTLLAGAELRPIAIASDSTAVYWLSQGLERTATGALHRYPKDGSPPTVLLGRLAAPRALLLAGGRVFVASGWGDISSVPVQGGPPARFASRGSPATSLFATSEQLFWADADEPAVLAAPLAGGPASLAALTRETGSIVTGSGADLWLLGAGTNTLSHLASGAERTEIVSNELRGPTSLLVDDTGIYVREDDGGQIRRLPPGKGAPVTLHERKAH